MKKRTTEKEIERRHQVLTELRGLARNKGGKLLSNTYVNTDTKLSWICVNKHKWETSAHGVKSGSWCPKCGLERRVSHSRLKLDELKKLAQMRGGKCLAKTYTNSSTPIEWSCSEGHIWSARANGVKRGSWCPTCNINRGEEICRQLFQDIWETRFPKSKPSWLKTKKGGRCELDGYSVELGIAFEHQGEQHYGISGNRAKNLNEYKAIRKRDLFKQRKCRKEKVSLFIIPEIPKLTKIEKIKDLIKKQAKEMRLPLPRKFNQVTVNLDKVFIKKNDPNWIKLQKVVKERGGKCISKKYHGNKVKLEFQCKKGHRWKTTPYGILDRGNWCPYCLGRHRTIKDMENFASKKGGECLSKKYINSVTKLRWKCKKNHTWQATPSNILSGRWCPKCGKKNAAEKTSLTLEDMKLTAKKMGGRCLSKTYKNSSEELLWECKYGHRWHAKPSGIRSRGDWCSHCAGKVKGSISEVSKYASKRGGKCLSKKYKNTMSHLLWECSKGHRWKATPMTIRKGHWCPKCAIERRSQMSKKTIFDMQSLAAQKNGQCLSKKYTNNQTKLKWKCNKGHIWITTPNSIQRGSWCPECAKLKVGASRKLKIEDIKKLAIQRGGICLSKKYVSFKAKLKWKCKEGHVWSTNMHNIRRGSWCPKCSAKKVGESFKFKLSHFQKIAKKKKGKCLSTKYVSCEEKMKWKCSKGHVWETSGAVIQKGCWCPICGRKQKS